MKAFVLFCVLVEVILKLQIRHVQTQYFTNTQPSDYYHRRSLTDCPKRFYKDFHPANIYYIHNGKRAFRGEFQHMVAIGWTTEEGVKYECGGTLITSKFVLTAAHCAVDRAGKIPDTVRLGDTDLNSSRDDEFAQQIKIRKFKQHPRYKPRKKYFDIALIELEESAESSEAVCSACLWLEKDVPSEILSAIGFGALEYAGNMSPTLQKAKLATINNTECLGRIFASTRSLPEGLHEDQFCAGGGTMDTCEGDSGGPIQTERVDVYGEEIPLVVGVVSFGTPCTDGSTGVYTRVASYRHWIESETNQSFGYSECVRNSECVYRKKVKTDITTPPRVPTYRVSLRWYGSDYFQFQCGATLIDYRFAITSASCISGKSSPPGFIESPISKEIVRVEKIFIHPEYYNGYKPENDLALVKLAMYLKVKERYSDPEIIVTSDEKELLPACLWREPEINQYRMFYSVYTDDDLRKGVRKPLIIEKEIIDNGRCTESLELRKNLLCANNKIPLIPSVCEMDYGGPISNGAYSSYGVSVPYLYGVVTNLSTGCGDDLIGTRIYPHIDWIESIVLDSTHERLVFSP